MVGPPPPSWAVTPGDASAQPILDGLWRLRLPLPWAHIPHVNAYAVADGDGGVTLVDCGGAGDPSCWDALAVALGQAGFTPADVRRIVLTHYHSDHAGLVARFVDEFGSEVLGHPDHAHFTDAMLRPGAIAAARERRAREEGVPPERIASYRTTREELEGVLAPVLPDRALADGDLLGSALGAWRVLVTPGHAPSHVCLHQPEADVLIAGDLVAPSYAPSFDYGYSADPIAETQASLDRLAALGAVAVTLPGHGRPLLDLPAALAVWRTGLHDAVEELARAVEQQPAGAYELMLRLHGPDDDAETGAWQLTVILCYLRHLRQSGRIVRERVDGRFRYVATAAAGQPAAASRTAAS